MAEESDLFEVNGLGSSPTALDGNLRRAGEVESTKWGVLTRTGWSRKRMMQACILVMAVTGAVLGTQHIITRLSVVYSHLHLQQDSDMLQVTSRASAPYRRPQVFRVGGANAEWVVPSTPDFFTSWAAGISFRVGDILHFVGATSGAYLYQVSATNYASCQTTNFIDWWTLDLDGGNDLFLQLISIQPFYFVTGDDPVSCTNGLKIAPIVYPMDIPAAPSRPAVNVPTRQPRVFEVGGDNATWRVPSTTNFYEDWASNISFIVGDELSFTLSNITFEVERVPYTSYEMCSPTEWTWYSQFSTTYQFTSPGTIYFVASERHFCVQGMRFAANVYGTTLPPTKSPSPSKSATSVRYIIVYVVVVVVVGGGVAYFYVRSKRKPPPPPPQEVTVQRPEAVLHIERTVEYKVTRVA